MNFANIELYYEPFFIDRAWVGKGLYRRKMAYGARGRLFTLKLKKAHMKFVIKEAKQEGQGRPEKKG